jgi:hypothetical protein
MKLPLKPFFITLGLILLIFLGVYFDWYNIYVAIFITISTIVSGFVGEKILRKKG